MTTEIQESTCFYLSPRPPASAGIRGMNHHAWLFMWVLGSKLKILVLAYQVQLSYLPRLMILTNKNICKISPSSLAVFILMAWPPISL